MRTAIVCFALALSIAPQQVLAGTVGARNGEALNDISQPRFALVPGVGSDMIVASEQGQRKFAPESRGVREAEGVRFADGVVHYVEGPSWDYHVSRRGPMFEVAALGGGMENAPYLAHVAMNWRF